VKPDLTEYVRRMSSQQALDAMDLLQEFLNEIAEIHHRAITEAGMREAEERRHHEEEAAWERDHHLDLDEP
jgi:hypothetical protein